MFGKIIYFEIFGLMGMHLSKIFAFYKFCFRNSTCFKNSVPKNFELKKIKMTALMMEILHFHVKSRASLEIPWFKNFELINVQHENHCFCN